MFYSTELLSLRRKGKLARCWLAATVSEKMFRQTCRISSINKIDVILLCEEILSTIEIRDGKCYGRFSLYLSSQLMYGATKILAYQTTIFQDHLFEISRKLVRSSQVKRHKNEFNARTAFELPEDPLLNEILRNPEMSSNLHLIMEDTYTCAVERLMQDQLNFGALTNFEMEQLMLPGMKQLSLDEIRRFCWNESTEIPEESVNIPLVDISKFDTIESEKETRVALARRSRGESLIDIEDEILKKHTPTMSRKRNLKSPAETPSKRMKITPEEAPAQPIPLEHPSELVPELAPAHVPEYAPPPAPVPECAPESEIRQERPVLEDTELIVVRKQRVKRKLRDKQIEISASIMQRCIQNVKAYTRELQQFTAILPSAQTYLTQPSTKISNKLWGITLGNVYDEYLLGPFFAQNEFPDVPSFEMEYYMEDTIPSETVRAETSKKSRDQTAEMTSKLAITATDITEHSKTIEKILPTEICQRKESVEHQEKEFEEISVAVPEVSGLEEKHGETIEKPQMTVDEKRPRIASKSSSSFCSRTYLSKTELLALLEIHWSETSHAKFHDLIPPNNYTKIDAACVFCYCLEFHKETVVVLKQRDPFDTIWIEKYPRYSSESD